MLLDEGHNNIKNRVERINKQRKKYYFLQKKYKRFEKTYRAHQG